MAVSSIFVVNLPTKERCFQLVFCFFLLGKYEFDPRISGVTSLNIEKSVVFGDKASERIVASRSLAAPPEGEPPPWAARPVDYATKSIMDNNDMSVVNDELSWEPFWARIEPTRSDMQVTPPSGTLAPRGGVGGYTDRCQFQVVPRVYNKNLDDDHVYLVVRTEQDEWVWRIEA